MKLLAYGMLLCLLFSGTTSFAQIKIVNTDSTVVFKVHGICEQCKHRIEEALKGKGVLSANWNIDSKMLTLEYNPSAITVAKIQKRILASGHDVETTKATDWAYNNLPSCCRYREMENIIKATADVTVKTVKIKPGDKVEKGQVLLIFQ